MSRHDVITLASIVEKEARLAEERPVISAVYHNRLKRGMLLQADPTVQYALGRHVDRVLYKDLEVDSRYIVVATLSALARDGQIPPSVAEQAIRTLGLNPDKANPAAS